MKILFICGSVEPGKDGVGDYIRQMCGALIKKNHTVHILALCDKFCQELIEEIQVVDKKPITVTRIPVNTLKNQRFTYTQNLISEFKPDWLSLQFVPYSFNSKGLPFWIPKFINKLRGNFSLHIMFHELWIGRLKEDGFKNKIISHLQEDIIKQLLKKNQPKRIHTQLPVYMANLERLGYKVMPLQLFSNINPSSEVAYNSSESIFRLAFFSQIETNSSIIEFINTLTTDLKEKGILSELVIIGGEKSRMLQHKEVLEKQCPKLTKVSYTGFLSELEISEVLRNCDFGITPVPRHALGKSGTIAAFFAHGIPVAAPITVKGYESDGIGHFNTNLIDAILTKPDVTKIQKAQKVAQSFKHMVSIENTCDGFINSLKQVV